MSQRCSGQNAIMVKLDVITKEVLALTGNTAPDEGMQEVMKAFKDKVKEGFNIVVGMEEAASVMATIMAESMMPVVIEEDTSVIENEIQPSGPLMHSSAMIAHVRDGIYQQVLQDTNLGAGFDIPVGSLGGSTM